MFKTVVPTIVFCFFTGPAFGQFSVTFQDGITPLLGGGIYEGTIDNELRSSEPGLVESQGANPEMTVDGDDGGNVTQGAIRFENLLISEGGLVPDQVATGAFQITNAVMSLWKLSPSSGANTHIEFSRVIGPDTTSGNVWQEDDFWAGLVDVLVPDPSGQIQEFPFRGDFDENNRFIGDGVEVAVNSEFEDLDFEEDSEDRLGNFEDAVLGGSMAPLEAFRRSFYEFDVTAAVNDWLVNGVPNYGWVINNPSGDGWDIATSEAEGELDHAFFNGSDVIPGVDTNMAEELPFGLLYGETPGSLLIDATATRPQLTIFYDGPGGAADLNLDGMADQADFDLFLANFGIEIDGPIPLGTPGDLDFDRDVDPADFLLFKVAFDGANGAGAFARLTAAVPEPTAGVLAVATMLLGARGRFRRPLSLRRSPL